MPERAWGFKSPLGHIIAPRHFLEFIQKVPWGFLVSCFGCSARCAEQLLGGVDRAGRFFVVRMLDLSWDLVRWICPFSGWALFVPSCEVELMAVGRCRPVACEPRG